MKTECLQVLEAGIFWRLLRPWLLGVLIGAMLWTATAGPYNGGPGGPILVVTNSANPFTEYYAEILLAEGLNCFALSDISVVTNTTLTNYDVVILGEMALTATEVTTLSNWVFAGGSLVAMRPDKQLTNLLGLVAASGTLSEGYLLVSTNSGPGAGVVGETMQFHGTADRYTLGGASSLATLYTLFSNNFISTLRPAVSWRSVGTNGGQAAAFTYDLARSIVYTRQGNPAWVDQNRDANITSDAVVRSDDLFYGATTNVLYGPATNDWVNLNKVAIPQADEQQRLLANLILSMASTRKLLPRFWYFPHGNKAAVVMTGDDHAGTFGGSYATRRFEQYLAASSPGGSVADWTVPRCTAYVYVSPSPSLTNDAQALAYQTNGFEISIHVNTDCSNYTPSTLTNFFTNQLSQFTSAFPSLAAPRTHRLHCLAQSGYTILPEVGLTLGIRLDTTYYYWPPGWILNRPGFFTGSGMPMRYATSNGAPLDVFQAVTQLTDESGQTYPFTIDTLLDRALGAEGYYGAFVANMHTDDFAEPDADAIFASATNRGVPIISARQLLTWLDARNNSSFSNLNWNVNSATFAINADPNATGLQAMLPVPAGQTAVEVLRGGTPIAYTQGVSKGVLYATFAAPTGEYQIRYAPDTNAPVVTAVTPTNGANAVSLATTVKVTFSEAMSAATLNPNTLTLSNAAGAPVTATVTYYQTTNTAVLTPTGQLDPFTTYTLTVTTGVTDRASNTLAAPLTATFTTADREYTLWENAPITGTPAVADTFPYELGVKFRSAIDGYVTGLRFYKGSGNGGLHIGNLWNAAGSNLATATYTGESATGWQQVALATPVLINSNTTYIASYFAPQGHYAFDPGYFATAGHTNPPLVALANGEDGGNGVYLQTTNTAWPNQTFNSANYWVDVVLVETLAPDTNAPLVSAVTPTNNATNVTISTAVTVTFNEAINPATLTANTITLSNAAGGQVNATLAYYAATHAAVLTPDNLLALATPYTLTVAGVQDLATNTLAAPYTATFTTTDHLSLWTDATTPAIPAQNDSFPYELGVKFQSDINGYVTGIRFYKGAGNGGTHTGNLWTLGGSNLATATFTGETASGWQQVNLATPVAIASKTTYVASYFAPQGHYALEAGYFATAGFTNPPLRALANGPAGGNGVFIQTNASAYPNQSFQSANYWVDVVVVTDVNTPPVANDDFYSLGNAPTLSVAAPGVLTNDTEIHGWPLTATRLTGPFQGALTLNADGAFSYTPTNHISGLDTFTYQANNAQTNSPPATVSLTVTNPIQITNIDVTDGLVTLTWTAIAGRSYQLEASDSLTFPSWTNLPPEVTASGATALGTNALDSRWERYYRVKLVGSP